MMGHGVSWCGARLQTAGDKTPRREAAEAEEHIGAIRGGFRGARHVLFEPPFCKPAPPQ